MWLPPRADGKILDVGCGNGRFLARMRELGWNPHGVEPDPEAAALARNRGFGDAVAIGYLDDVPLQAGSFDVVTLRHVVEHSHDPVNLLRQCARLLCPGGRLVALTPNVKGLGHRIFHGSWGELDPPRHLCLFSPATLKRCVTEAGLRVLNIRTTSRAAREIWYSSRQIKSCMDARRRRPGLIVQGLLYQILEHALECFDPSLGEEIVLIAERSAS